LHGAQRIARARRLDHAVARAPQPRGKQAADRRLVVHHQNFRLLAHSPAFPFRSSASGKRIVKIAPARSARFAAETLSPIASAKPFTMARPSPVPPLRSDPSIR